MKSLKVLILFVCVIGNTKGQTQNYIEDQSGDTIVVRNLPQTSIIGIKELLPDTLLVGMIDSSTYYSDLLIFNKLELVLQDEALNYPHLNHVKLVLTTPNRDSLNTEYTMKIVNILEELRFKYRIPKYVEVVHKIGELIEQETNSFILSDIDTDLSLIIYKDEVIEKAFFGVSTLNIVLNQIIGKEPEKSLYSNIIKDYEELRQSQPDVRFQFRKEVIEILKSIECGQTK